MIYNASEKSYFILKRWGSLRKLHSQHLASSRPSEQSLTPSHTFLRGMQRPSPQRNWRGQAGDGQRATLDIICFRWVCKKKQKVKDELTALWGKGSVEQEKALVSEGFIRVEVKGQRRGENSLFAAVWYWITQSKNGAGQRQKNIIYFKRFFLLLSFSRVLHLYLLCFGLKFQAIIGGCFFLAWHSSEFQILHIQ